MNRLLDQVFDEYGLIVCGWSADWDAALRAAIERCPNRRYTTYWSAFREVTGIAEQLCRKRAAQVIGGMGADEFFSNLSEKVAALKDMDARHPLTVRIAVATLKRYLPENKCRIRLHDLVMEESNKVATALFSDLGGHRRTPSLKECEARVEMLLHLLAAGAYWGRAAHRRLWLRCFQQLGTPRSGPFSGLAVELDFYPAYLALHAYGIAALAAGRQGNLAYILAHGSSKMPDGSEISLLHRLMMELRRGELDNAIQRAEPSRRDYNLPSSRYLLERLREPLREWLPEDSRYEDLFRRFEYTVSLVVSDLYQKTGQGSFCANMGFHLNRRRLHQDIQAEIEKYKDSWPYLKAGLFDGSLSRLHEVKTGHDEASSRLGINLGFS
jgi:hypothetical protein